LQEVILLMQVEGYRLIGEFLHFSHKGQFLVEQQVEVTSEHF